ncbi:hypothetical protein F7731_24570 [Cytobacillus depressus]|uniref:Uncharacterized protein n=1 Tax=Cytobacillus depressus TaxID=1602942 RepID=A0A6L3V006_9BACI|nr:hypothetical protein [Cytobacillus depressus]KAB2328696.1 hypothetical protein F7731_24570 [Cytobacillus depressus]
MNKTLRTKFMKYLAFLLIGSIVAGVSYLIVYKVSFLPKGYDIVALQKDSISLKSFNVLGIEKTITTVSFSEKDTWKIDAINYEVNRQKEFLWLLFLLVTLSIILFVYKVRNGLKLWQAIIESKIIFAALPLYIIITTLNRIRDLIY